MALTEQQKNEIKAKYSIGVDIQQASPQDERLARIQSLRQDIKSSQGGFMADIKGIGTGIADSFKSRQEKGQAIAESNSGFGQKAFQALGQGAGFLSDVVGNVAMGGIKAVTPEFIQQPVGEAVKSGVEAIAQTPAIQSVVEKYQALDDNTKRNIDALIGFGSLATDITGAGLLKKPAMEAGKAVVETGINVAKTGVELAKPVINLGKNVVTDTATGITDFAKRIPVNVAETQAQRASVKSLGSKTLQKAAREGIDVVDLQDIKNIPKSERPKLKILSDVVKNFAEGKSKTNPFEVVGKPIVNRLKTLDNQVKGYTKQLDTVANKLSGQFLDNVQDVRQGVFDGLQELKVGVSKGGKLIYEGSNLEGLGNGGKLIENVFKRIMKTEDASDLHRLKKFIDENVDYGKRVEGLTGSAEKLLKTWRRSIDTALDTQFPAYNKVNTELAKRIQPLNDLKDLLKNADGLDTDLLAEKAGILARRITSAAPSRPEVKQILRNIDRFTSSKGKTLLSTERLQDFYNILNKYYDIAPKTGFQNLVKEGVDAGTSVLGMAKQLGTKFAGKSQAVRQKAFEDALKELFSK